MRPAAWPPLRELPPPLFCLDVTVSLAPELGGDVGVIVTVLIWPLVTVSTDAIGVGVQVDDEVVEVDAEELIGVDDAAAEVVCGTSSDVDWRMISSRSNDWPSQMQKSTSKPYSRALNNNS